MKIEVLDSGYVEFIEAWGKGSNESFFPGENLDKTDYEVGIVEAARQSTQGSFRGWEPAPCDCGQVGQTRCRPECSSVMIPGDKKLLSFLYQNGHSTPFEFAGIFDGEGNFGCHRSHQVKLRGSWPYRYQIYGSISLREGWLLNHLASLIGCKEGWKGKKRSEKHSDSYRIHFAGEALRQFLSIVGSYLVLKRELGQLFLEWSNLKKARSFRPITQKEYLKETSFYKRMRLLNLKGVGKARIPIDLRPLF